MRRKLIIIFAVIAAATLLSPVRLDLKDGGSVSYKSLVYEVTKLHRFDPEANGVKPYIDGLQLKIFGMTFYNSNNG